MTRLIAAMRMDVTVQWRNKLYVIGIVAGVLVAGVLALLFAADQLYLGVPTLMLLVVGGSTLLYVAGLITFERDEGTLSAVIVSPLRTTEYLWSKVITLTGLATLESAIMIGGAMLILGRNGAVPVPNIPIMLIGIISMGVIYTLLGVVLIVRYDKITDFLLPMAAIASILQLPLFHFLDVVVSPLFLIIPTSASTMLIRGAYIPLTAGEWLYAIGYTAVQIVVLAIWAYRAFNTHIIRKAG
jgi:fluoroquinolone transport system permease protein